MTPGPDLAAGGPGHHYLWGPPWRKISKVETLSGHKICQNVSNSQKSPVIPSSGVSCSFHWGPLHGCISDFGMRGPGTKGPETVAADILSNLLYNLLS